MGKSPPSTGPVQSVETTPQEFAQVAPRDLHPVADIRLVIADVAKLTERIDGLIAAVEKQGGTFEKALDKHAADVKERIGDLKADSKEIRDKIVDVEKSISGFEGSFRAYARIYALALVVVAALLAWFLKPVPSPIATQPTTAQAPPEKIGPPERSQPEGIDRKAPKGS